MEVSIIIPYLDRPEWFKKCINSVLITGGVKKIEVIIIDNSKEGDCPIPKDKRIRKIRSPKNWNIGYVEACNIGMKESKGKLLVLMNADVVVTTTYWLKLVIRYFSENKHVGLIGPVGKEVMPGAGVKPPAPGEIPVDYVVGSLLIFPSEIYKLTKGYDKGYSPCFFEDVDFSYQVRSHGYKTIQFPRIEILHPYGVCERYDGSELKWKNKKVNLQRLTEKNRALFCAKWKI